jgi:hypothetical protein
MQNITAYAEEVTVTRNGSDGYRIADTALSARAGYPVVIAYVTVARGFLHYTGDRFSAHKGIEAVIAPRMEEGPNHPETIRRVLREGLVNGRDDRR